VEDATEVSVSVALELVLQPLLKFDRSCVLPYLVVIGCVHAGSASAANQINARISMPGLLSKTQLLRLMSGG